MGQHNLQAHRVVDPAQRQRLAAEREPRGRAHRGRTLVLLHARPDAAAQAAGAPADGPHGEQEEEPFVWGMCCSIAHCNQAAARGERDAPCKLANRILVDSGCSYHLFNSRSFFGSVDETVRVKIKVGDGRFVYSTGAGAVRLRVKDAAGHFVVVEMQALYVPDLATNLVSVSQLNANGTDVLLSAAAASGVPAAAATQAVFGHC